MRQIEKLRNEACDNGNINWDDNFSWFCDFIGDTLNNANISDAIALLYVKNPQPIAYTKNPNIYR